MTRIPHSFCEITYRAEAAQCDSGAASFGLGNDGNVRYRSRMEPSRK
ncbi:MAG: hypothetical protein SPE13_00560 [Alloprevotella sp.]|nr:hypothetical protein [Alloprevotella sp.]